MSRSERVPYGQSLITDGQRKLLEQALTGPVTVSDDIKKRLVEQIVMRKWATSTGHLSTALTFTITERGRNMLNHPATKKLYRRKDPEL